MNRGTERTSPVATVAVACVATAMLMLDISVVNTALSKIADSLDTGLSGLQWLVDGYTVPLAADLPDQCADWRCRTLDHLSPAGRGPRPDAPPDRLARTGNADRRTVPAGAGAAARKPGRLGEHGDRGGAGRGGGAAGRVRGG